MRLEEILFRLTPDGIPPPLRKILFWGEGTGEIASYAAGWMVGRGMEVIVLDGANRFNPYIVSSFARKASISPEEILKRIRIARAFTCYQMATLVGERLPAFLEKGRGEAQAGRPRVILLGLLTTFLDEDVPERESSLLFERALGKVGEMAEEGVSFFLFQPSVPFGSKRASLMKRLSQFSDRSWKMTWEDQGPRLILEREIRPPLPVRRESQRHGLLLSQEGS